MWRTQSVRHIFLGFGFYVHLLTAIYDHKRNNLCFSKPKYVSAGFARRNIFGFYLIYDPYDQTKQ